MLPVGGPEIRRGGLRVGYITYHAGYEDVGVVPDVVVGTLQLDTIQVYALIDPEASHSFVSYRIVNNLCVSSSNLGVKVMVSTPLGDNMHIDDIYRGVKL